MFIQRQTIKSDGGWRFRSVCGGGLTAQFMSSGLLTDLFNSSASTLPELPHQQNQPLTFPLRRPCRRIKSRYWDNRENIAMCHVWPDPVFAVQPLRFNTHMSLCFCRIKKRNQFRPLWEITQELLRRDRCRMDSAPFDIPSTCATVYW